MLNHINTINRLPSFASRMLTLSTAHISKRTDEELTKDDPSIENMGEYIEDHIWSNVSRDIVSHGYLFPVSEDQMLGALRTGHPELANLFRIALEAKFDYLKLDCDGPRLPAEFGAPEFEW